MQETGRGRVPLSWPHLQEGPSVGGVEGVQGLLQPPLFGKDRSPRHQAQARTPLKPLNVLPQASEEGSCGTRRIRGEKVRPGPLRTPPGSQPLLPGAVTPQKEKRSRGPSPKPGLAAMLLAVCFVRALSLLPEGLYPGWAQQLRFLSAPSRRVRRLRELLKRSRDASFVQEA